MRERERERERKRAHVFVCADKRERERETVCTWCIPVCVCELFGLLGQHSIGY